MNENKDNFLAALKKDLENDLSQLRKEKEEESQLRINEFREGIFGKLEEKQKENKAEVLQIIKNEAESLKSEIESAKKELLAKMKKENEEKISKLETKLKNFYYWLFGVALILLVIILGVLFALRGSSNK